MGTEGQLRDEAAKFAFQKVDDGIPEVGAHEVAVEEDDRDAASAVVIMQSAMWEVNDGHFPTSSYNTNSLYVVYIQTV
jgi:hypothetical protein